jgi:hypothetical protein
VAVETAADRAAMFSTEDHAVAALYTPPGGGPDASLLCAVVLDVDRGRRDPFELPIGDAGMRATIARGSVMILADQVPVVELGGRIRTGELVASMFVPGPDAYRIASEPRRDESGHIWWADISPVAGAED